MHRPAVFITGFLMVLLLASACQGQSATVPGTVASSGDGQFSPQRPGRSDWQLEWEKVVADGQREGTVVVISSVGPTQREALAKGAKEAYKLDVEFVTGAGTSSLTRTKAERGAGLYASDILLGGPTTQLLYRDSGFLDPVMTALILPDIKDPKNWFNGVFPYMDARNYIVSFQTVTNAALIINTEMVRSDEITSYKDLLDPKWKGKMILQDPTISGRGNNLVNSVMWEVLGENYVRALAKQELVITRDIRLQVETVSRGKYSIGLAATQDVVMEFKNAGAPIKEIHLKEGGSIGASQGSVSILNKPAHPNAARILINWLLGREGQLVIGKALGNASRRIDVPTDYVNPDMIPKPGVKYIDTDTEEQIHRRGERQIISREIFSVR